MSGPALRDLTKPLLAFWVGDDDVFAAETKPKRGLGQRHGGDPGGLGSGGCRSGNGRHPRRARGRDRARVAGPSGQTRLSGGL